MRPFKKKQPFLKNNFSPAGPGCAPDSRPHPCRLLRRRKNFPTGNLLSSLLPPRVRVRKRSSCSAGSADTQLHFIDVGQGLSVLAESDGHFLLFDGGDRKTSSLVVSYLKEQGVETLDYVIASHYDADHLNGVVGAERLPGIPGAGAGL